MSLLIFKFLDYVKLKDLKKSILWSYDDLSFEQEILNLLI